MASPPPLVVIARPSSSNVFLLVAAILLHFSFHVSVAQFFPHTVCGADASNATDYTPNSTFSSNLGRLLASLSANATRNRGFTNANFGLSTPSDAVYGLSLCRGDVASDICGSCVGTASSEILKRCGRVRQAAIWYDYCMLRYSNQSFFSTLDATPVLTLVNTMTRNFTDGAYALQVLRSLLDLVANHAANDQSPVQKFDTMNATFSPDESLYSLAQCTPDLSSTYCQRCLRGAIEELKSCCDKRQGARVILYSCNIRYEVHPFYNPTANTTAPPPDTAAPPPDTAAPPPHTGGNRANTTKIKVVVSVLSVTAAIGIICILRRIIDCKRKAGATEELLVGDLGQLDATDVQSRYQSSNTEMQYFNLASISDATNNFSEENKLGQGGFGPVYKGKLQDGKEIAVKRLRTNSGQGLQEFETEVLLIVKLQHKNLVRLLGCCMEKGEKLLVYEYMPNTSLDAFLFDEIKSQKLGWPVRANIVNGIARGLLYLHEDSRLKIIHRDLKASNILLDDEMNPKISDFGTARIFGGNQIEESTNRVVGTYGYMSPEYAMDGLFSVKSDVYSYGVLLLEILSGKKISNFHHQEHAQGLLAYAWRVWNEGKGLELIDRNLIDHCPGSVALKWIHIALLCIQEDPGCRPTMSSVIFMLGGELPNLPRPLQPPLFGRFVMYNQSSSSNSGLSSINDVSMSDQYPR